MNKTPLLEFVYNRKKTAATNREAAVELRITFERKQKNMTTGIRLLPKHWHRGAVVNRIDARELNETLEKQTFTIPLLSPALAVLKKYQNKLPVISNVKYNEYLKVVAQAAGIDKPVSSHWARHTGATLLLNEGGMDLKTVAKICGHLLGNLSLQMKMAKNSLSPRSAFWLMICMAIYDENHSVDDGPE